LHPLAVVVKQAAKLFKNAWGVRYS
jgi:hypothetical protein